MSYGSVADVKLRLGIDGTSYDTEIASMLTAADAYIDEKLSLYTSVPLTSAPTIIKTASNDLAASYFRANHVEVVGKEDIKRDLFHERAMEALDLYIDINYVKKSYKSSPSFDRLSTKEVYLTASEDDD